jgi:hypothetical protein
MRRAFSSLLVGGAAASGGGTIKLNWSDCGDSSTHGHITSLSPTSVVLGTKTSLAGKGTIDKAIPAATYKVVAKEGFIPIFSHSGDACKPGTIKLPAGVGEINMKGFKCPLSPGDAELDLDLSLSASIPAKLARITIVLTAESSSGDKALCVQIKTAPENLIVDEEHPENLIPAIGDSEQCQPWGRDCGLHGTKQMGECCPGLQCVHPTPRHELECRLPSENFAAIASSPDMTGDAMVSENPAQELPPIIGTLVCKLAEMGEPKAIDAICQKVPIPSCQDALQKVFDKLLAKCQPGDEDFVEGGKLQLGWIDCGDSSYHAKVTSLTPSTLTIGANTHVVGQGNVDEEVTAGSFSISSKAIIGPAEHFSGNVCQPKTFNLPMGLATITWDGLKCPVAKGQADVGVNVKLAASIPAKLARTTIDLKATSSSGHNLICMQMTTAPQQDATVVV